MNCERTEKAVRESIAAMAAKSFEHHRITADGEGSFVCRKPGDSHYWFGVVVKPGMILVYGDIGEYVFRVSDRDALGWFLTAGSAGSIDYVLGKVRASDGARREFMIDDARAMVTEWENEAKGEDVVPCRRCVECVDEEHHWIESMGLEGEEYVCKHCDVTCAAVDDPEHGFVASGIVKPSDDGTPRTSKNVKLDHYAEVQRVLASVEYDSPDEQQRAWWEILHEINFDEPPAADGWTGSMLWLWHAILTFRRLWDHPEDAKSAIATDATATFEGSSTSYPVNVKHEGTP